MGGAQEGGECNDGLIKELGANNTIKIPVQVCVLYGGALQLQQ